ncbi:MAG: valine--tRNA ligase, partial [Alphaproteobacteria bacterium]|nr:valine--tRNA ligase [Alphaproteobacteria bacterium]
VTGFDIIFFWVARMMMMGMHFMDGEVPFCEVYIHALVRDEKGQKMSKSKGNVMDPLELIDKYGADALRMTLVALAAQGRDIKLSENRVEGYRNFATKLWNAARFCEFNNCSFNKEFNPSSCSHPINSWIISKLFITTAELELSLEKFRFNDAASSIYNFTWGTFCDWYLEFAKPLFLADDKSAIEETKSTVAWVLTQLLRLLHPFMPFITEELWKNFGEDKSKLLINESWPLIGQVVGKETDREIDWVVDLVAEVRSVRSEANVPAASIIPLIISSADEMRIKAIETHSEIIKKLARLTDIKISRGSPPKNSIQTVIGSSTLILPLGDVIDFEKELERLESQKQKLVIDISKISKKLSDNKFLDKAPKDIVDLQRERLGKNEKSLEKLNESIARLK